MSRDNLTSRLYNLSSACKSAIKAQQIQGHEDIMCSAILYKKGKKLNSIDKADTKNFSRLMLTYVRNEDPDKMKIELRGDQDELLWTKTFSIDPEPAVQISTPTESKGLGEAEISDIVNQKLTEIRRSDELEDLRSYCDKLEQENEVLQKQLADAENVLDAKKQLEYYSNIIGLAFPGFAKMLKGTSIGPTLNMLAGIDSETDNDTASNSSKSERDSIIELVTEFLKTLDDINLGHLYLVFVELSNDPGLIPNLISLITQKPNNHEVQKTS